MMEEKIKNLIEEEVKKLDVYIDNIEYVKENGNYFLRITIDADYIIDIDKCVEVTEVINPILDKVNFIDDSYILDITTKEKVEV
jgi:ribosome maturation factor RimP